jgi:glycerol uptake facilitator protein
MADESDKLDRAEDVVDEIEKELEAPLARRLAAEFVGTLAFVAIGTGAATVLLRGPALGYASLARDQALAGAPEEQSVFLNIFANSIGDTMAVAFAFAAALATLIYALGGVSGAHFNPAVTFALAVVRRFRWVEVPMYWVVQIAGGIAGAFVIAGIYKEEGAVITEQVSSQLGERTFTFDVLFGATVVAPNIDIWQAILAEALIAFILVTAIMAVAVDPRAPKGWSGWVIGLALAGGIIVTAAATGGSANFARSLGPYVASLPFDVGEIPWGDLIVYAVGPLIGAAAAALVYESLTGLERFAPAPSPGAATHDEDVEAAVIVETEVETETKPKADPDPDPKARKKKP